jgi:lysophospholipase L1-like esterase
MGKLGSPKPSFVLIGDSITNGTVSLCVGCHGSSQDANGNSGWLEQAVGQQQPWTNFSRVGTTILDWLAPMLLSRMQETITMLHPSHVVDELGTNDQASDISYATFMARKQRLWLMLKQSGVGEIWITTITPNCASTYGIDATPTIVSGGSGYGANATFNVVLAGASCTIAPTANVTSDPNGVVTHVNSYQVGACITSPATPNAVSGGTGSGLLLGLDMAKAVNLATQKAGSSNGAIQTFNANARANAYRVFGVTKTLDVARVVEQGTTGTWQPGMSKDCLHPSLAGHTAIALAMAGEFGDVAIPTADDFVSVRALAIK